MPPNAIFFPFKSHIFVCLKTVFDEKHRTADEIVKFTKVVSKWIAEKDNKAEEGEEPLARSLESVTGKCGVWETALLAFSEKPHSSLTENLHVVTAFCLVSAIVDFTLASCKFSDFLKAFIASEGEAFTTKMGHFAKICFTSVSTAMVSIFF